MDELVAYVPTVVGGAMILIGALTCAYWYLYWNRNYRGDLLTGGPYAVVRHPLYTGFMVLTFGLAIAVPFLETLMLGAITLVILGIYIPKEEQALLEQYGKKYREYTKRVPWKLIPKVY
jgi:protein-S-isoprenylcysteine O-methyltransferase Ste14